MTIWPTSLREINELDTVSKEAIYRTLLPEWLFSTYPVSRDTLCVEGKRVVHFRCPAGSRALEVTVKRRPDDVDPLLYLNMADTFNNQILVLLVLVNDLDSPRYDIDVDSLGRSTQLGTINRNLEAEHAAMTAGLSPGQVRRGLRIFRHLMPVFESFVRKLQHQMFLIEPLAYHNAIMFEQYGFGYVRGQKEMEEIHREFQPGGRLFRALTRGENPFRKLDAWNTIRGRSWAIHDGILGHPYTGFQMYKLLDKKLGINTFPDARW